MLKQVSFFLALLLFVSLAVGAFGEEIVVQDPDNGIWSYAGEGIQIEVARYEDSDKKLIWFEIDLQLSQESPLYTVLSNPKKPGSGFKNPERLARMYDMVLAVNDDYFGDRTYNKETPGIIIRGGEIVREKTYKSGGHSLPNLDTMALFPDGSMQVFQSKEKTAAEYLELGAIDVLSFGPILIRDGEMNPLVDEYYKNKEPRTAIGMIEPHHYVMIVAEGRHGKSKGTGLQWIAKRLHEMGAVQAFNLDGGQSSALVFMGDKINTTGKYGAKANIRNLSGMIGAGVSGLVLE